MGGGTGAPERFVFLPQSPPPHMPDGQLCMRNEAGCSIHFPLRTPLMKGETNEPRETGRQKGWTSLSRTLFPPALWLHRSACTERKLRNQSHNAKISRLTLFVSPHGTALDSQRRVQHVKVFYYSWLQLYQRPRRGVIPSTFSEVAIKLRSDQCENSAHQFISHDIKNTRNNLQTSGKQEK